MNEYPKVLVACPTYVGKKYAMKEWIANVKSFDYPNYDILLVDNSNSDAFISNYEGQVPYIHIKADQHLAMKRVTSSMEKIRQKFLKEDYAYWFNLEIDVIPEPRDTIQQLLAFTDKFDLISHAYPARKLESYDHQGVGCAIFNRNLASSINYDLAGNVSPDGFLWSKIRKHVQFKMIELWNLINIKHLNE